jgi:hypothetical protein
MPTLEMPDLCSPTRVVRHTIDSALPTLLRVGVDVERIVLQMAGAGWAQGTVVAQSPAPGRPLTTQTRVILGIAGTGTLESLPYSLRDEDEDGFGADRLCALFDNPIQKLGAHLRAAGGFLDLHPAEPAGALRWIEEIFQLSSAPWPEQRWYDLARFLPSLHRLAGRPEAVHRAFRVIFKVPVARVRVVSGIAPLNPDRQTRLGVRNGRLAVDAVIGEGVSAAAALEVTIGPVDLNAWRRLHNPAERRQREAIYRLVLPCHLYSAVRERWLVGERSEAGRLLEGDGGTLLGVNCYLGGSATRSAA